MRWVCPQSLVIEGRDGRPVVTSHCKGRSAEAISRPRSGPGSSGSTMLRRALRALQRFVAAPYVMTDGTQLALHRRWVFRHFHHDWNRRRPPVISPLVIVRSLAVFAMMLGSVALDGEGLACSCPRRGRNRPDRTTKRDAGTVFT